METSYSLKILGSNELSNQIRKDTKELVETAAEKKVKPVMFSVGVLFVEVLIARTLRKNLNLIDQIEWDLELDNHASELMSLFNEEKIKVYSDCELNDGKLTLGDEKQVSGFPVFFDPNEEYICLTVVDPNSKAEPGESQTKDGYPYYFLKYNQKEVLIDFLDNLKI